VSRTSTHGRRGARDHGSSTVEYSLMVAALAAGLVGVIMAAGALARDGIGHTCSGLSSQLALGGTCAPAGSPEGSGSRPAAGNASASEDDARTANNLGLTTDDT
jgi:hypothetical protein